MENIEGQGNPQDGAAEIRWAPLVRQDRIRRLYEQDAAGIPDDELLIDVGYAFYLRCRSILTVTAAAEGRVQCPRCERAGEKSVILRVGPAWIKDDLLLCNICGWETTWDAYHRTYKKKQLHGGGALGAFQDYLSAFDRARSTRERMQAIDSLIHRFHWEQCNMPGRTAGVNLIEGGEVDVFQFLDTLTYGAANTPGVQETRTEWYEKLKVRESIYGVYPRSHPSAQTSE